VTTGGKQYRVSPGDIIDVEKLPGEIGTTVMLTPVMMIGQGADVMVGTPVLTEARVEAQIVTHKRGKKKLLFSSISGARATAGSRAIVKRSRR
jgi:large subunit ribosomal protein L21